MTMSVHPCFHGYPPTEHCPYCATELVPTANDPNPYEDDPDPSDVGAKLPPRGAFYRPGKDGPKVVQQTRGADEECYDFLSAEYTSSLWTAGLMQQVFATRRRWRAISVLLNVPKAYFASPGAYVRVLVYGRNEKTANKALFASGIVGGETIDQLADSQLAATAVGSHAQFYEVYVGLAGGTDTANDPWAVSAVATDEATGGCCDVGGAIVQAAAALPAVLPVAAVLPAGLALPTWKCRVAALTIVNTTGGARFLQFHDRAAVIDCVGVAPVFSINPALPVDDQLRDYRFSRLGLVAYPSTTAGVGSAPVASGDLVFTVTLQ